MSRNARLLVAALVAAPAMTAVLALALTRGLAVTHGTALAAAAVAVTGMVATVAWRWGMRAAPPDTTRDASLLRQFLENTPAAVAMFDAGMRYIWHTRRWTEDYGLQRADLTGLGHYDVFPEIPERWKEIHRECLQGRVRSATDDAFARADGSVQYLDWQVHPWYRRDGEVGGLIMATEDVSARKHAEIQLVRLNDELETRVAERTAALTASEELFRLAMQFSPIGMALVDPQGRWLDLNQAFSRIVGWTRDELRGRRFADITHPDDLAVNMAERQRLIDGGADTYQLEKRYLHRDGRAVWVQLNASVVRGEDGSPRYFIGQIQDISARRQIEQITHAVSAELATLEGDAYYEAAARALAGIVDAEIAFVALVDARAPGAVRAAALVEDGRRLDGAQWAIPGTPLEGVVRGQVRVVRDDAAASWPGDAYLRDQGIRGLAITALHDPDGRLLGYLGAMKRAPFSVDDALVPILRTLSLAVSGQTVRERSRRQYRDLFELAPDALLMVTGEGMIMRANRQAESMFGHPRHRLVGQDLEILVPEEKRAAFARVRARYMQLRQRRPRGDTIRLEAMRADGGRLPVEITANPVETDEGMVTSISVRDITERQRAQDEINALNSQLERRVAERTAELESVNRKLDTARAEAEQANRAKSVFLANMSHELRTPLNAVIGYSEMLVEDYADEIGEEIAEDLGRIEGAAKHLLALINDILDISKIEAGKMELSVGDCDFGALVRQVVRATEQLVRKGGNRLLIEGPGDSPLPVTGDCVKLRQILFNLVSNAAKFTDGGTITIDYAVHAGTGRPWLDFTVRDTGRGIDPGKLDRLFADFSQVHEPTGGATRGTGLGLAICRRFLDMMGGTIEVDSAPGQGAAFHVRVPAVLESGSTPVARTAVSAAARAGRDAANDNHLVLVIDDEADARELIVRYLTRYGYQVSTASTGTDGIEMARRLHPDAITLDIIMPDMSGWDVLAALKSGRRTRDIPVVLVSITAERDRGLSLGAVDHLTKPLNHRELRDAIRRSTGRTDGGYVLVIEDDDDARSLMVRQLHEIDQETQTAADGNEALSVIERHGRPRLVLLDLIMPGMNGVEFLNALRAMPGFESLPVIVVTAKELLPSEQAHLERECLAVLRKGSMTPGDMFETVARVLAPGDGPGPPA